MAFRNVNSAHLFASERSPEQLSKAQMSTFSLLALSAPDCYDLQQKPPKHAHSSPRQPQLRRLTDLCSHRQALGHPYAKAAKWSAGQGRGKYPHHRQQDGALPARLPAQDFLCQTDVEEVNGAAPAQVAARLVDPVRNKGGAGRGSSRLPGYTSKVLAVLRRLRETALYGSEPFTREGLEERSLLLDGVTAAY